MIAVWVSATLMLGLLMAAQAGGEDSAAWWNRDWRHRLRVQLPPPVTTEAVTVWVDFAEVLKDLKLAADQLDTNSVRVLEVDEQGKVKQESPSLFEERIGKTAGWGWITWLRGEGNRYQIYFDVDGNGPKEPPKQDLPKRLSANAVNLVPNPGFEEADAYYKGRLPANWRFSARDAVTKKYRGDLDFVSIGYTWSEEHVRSGRKSLKLSLGKAMGKWDEIYFKNPMPPARVPALRGRRIHACAFAYLGSGSGIIPFSVQDSGEKGWIKNITAQPMEGKKGKWFPIETTGVLDEKSVRLQIMSSESIPNRDLLYYLDDFNVQAAVSDLVIVSLDKAAYSLGDEKAHVTVKLNVGRESLLPAPATVETLNELAGELKVEFKVVPDESLLRSWKVRLSITAKGRRITTRELPAQKASAVALPIANLKAGQYTLIAELLGDGGKPLLSVTKPFRRIAGPFD